MHDCMYVWFLYFASAAVLRRVLKAGVLLIEASKRLLSAFQTQLQVTDRVTLCAAQAQK